MTMNCNSVLEQLSAYMDGEIAAESAAQVQLHIASCETCAQELGQFRQLSVLVRAHIEPSNAPLVWDAIAVRLGHSMSGTSIAAGTSLTDQRNQGLTPVRSLNWKAVTGTIAALAASVLILANFFAPNSNHTHSTNLASVASVNLQPVLEWFQRDSNSAINVLNSQFELKDVAFADVDDDFGRPTYVSTASKVHVLPGNATVASTKTFSFPSCQCPDGRCTCDASDCNCIACVCERPDGSTYLVIEQCKSQAVSFGDLPVQLVVRDGREVQQVTVNGTRAVSFNHDSGKVTVVGLRNDAEIDSLFASL